MFWTSDGWRGCECVLSESESLSSDGTTRTFMKTNRFLSGTRAEKTGGDKQKSHFLLFIFHCHARSRAANVQERKQKADANFASPSHTHKKELPLLPEMRLKHLGHILHPPLEC